MAEPGHIMNLVHDQTSPDNNLRRRAELEFNQLSSQDPSNVAYILVHSALEESYPVDIKQACLLHLRRLVPKHWSIGFESFSGTAIGQELKQSIRGSLIKLVTSTGDSKIRNGCSYVIVQIAIADYPDEWPDLLQVLFDHTKDFSNANSMKGGLQVLNDLFDDLVTEEQFWDQGIGSIIINHMVQILSQPNLGSDIKLSVTALYKSVITVLQSPEALNDPNRKHVVYDHIKTSSELYCQLLSGSIMNSQASLSSVLDFVEIEYRTSIYSVLSSLIGNFNKKVSVEVKNSVFNDILKDVDLLLPIYLQISNQSDDLNSNIISSSSGDSYRDITRIFNELISTISLLQHSIHIGTNWNGNEFDQFVNKFVSLSTLTISLIDNYESDINEFVNDVTGLSGFVNIRDSVLEFISELNSIDSNRFFGCLYESIATKKFTQWNYTESCLYLLEGLFQNDDSDLKVDSHKLEDLLNHITSLVRYDNDVTHHSLLTSRVFLLLPKFFEKFENKVGNHLLTNTFLLMIDFVSQLTGDDFVLVSSLISLTNYSNLVDLKDYIQDFNKIHNSQESIFRIIVSLLDEVEDDTLAVLLEALSIGINLDPLFAANSQINNSVPIIDLVLQIAFKNPANIQVVVESSNCLKVFLQNINTEVYISCCERSLPVIFNLIDESFVNNEVQYSPKLDLGLDLLNIIMESVPGGILPPKIFNYTYPTLKKLLLLATDDQLLQSGGTVFNTLIQVASESFEQYKDEITGETGMNSLLAVVSKFLSPQLSDRAASNCGDIVNSLISKYQQLGDDFLSQILKATAERLVIAKEVITIENLIMLFCNLVLLSPESMINFLNNNVMLRDPKTGNEESGLSLILPIWFQSFEVTRGYEKIKSNALALAKIYSLSDQRVENIIVNGDIIPYEGDKILTRSMTKSMPERYTRISASLKILKLLVGELEFQCQQPNADDYLPNEQEVNEEGGDDDGWEDLEDIGVPNYDKLKSYIDSDDENNNETPNDEGLKDLLVQFFKECASRNISNFQKYYEQLSDEEKQIITENVLF